MDFFSKTYKTEKVKKHHQFLHIQNSLGTNFQLIKVAILNFWTKSTQRRYYNTISLSRHEQV